MGGNSFGFMNLGQAAQGQPPIQQQAPQAYGTMPLGTTDPQSQYLAQALRAMQGQQQGSVGGLTSNLMADALMQYGLKRRQDQQGQQQAQGQGLDQSLAYLNGKNDQFASGLGGG